MERYAARQKQSPQDDEGTSGGKGKEPIETGHEDKQNKGKEPAQTCDKESSVTDDTNTISGAGEDTPAETEEDEEFNEEEWEEGTWDADSPNHKALLWHDCMLGCTYHREQRRKTGWLETDPSHDYLHYRECFVGWKCGKHGEAVQREHAGMSWTACTYDNCHYHLSEKQGANWFPKRPTRGRRGRRSQQPRTPTSSERQGPASGSKN
jgi:hypothetical protein